MTISFESATAHKVIMVNFELKTYIIRKENTLRTHSADIRVYLDTNKDIDNLEKGLLKNGFIEETIKNAEEETTMGDC